MTDNNDSDHPGDDESTERWEETALWEGIEDAKNDRFVRPDQDFEF